MFTGQSKPESLSWSQSQELERVKINFKILGAATRSKEIRMKSGQETEFN